MQRIPIDEIVTDPSVTRQSNSIPTTFLLSTPKEVFPLKNTFIFVQINEQTSN